MDLTSNEINEIKEDLEEKKGVLTSLQTKHAVCVNEKEKLLKTLKDDFGVESSESLRELLSTLNSEVESLITRIKQNMKEADEILSEFEKSNAEREN